MTNSNHYVIHENVTIGRFASRKLAERVRLSLGEQHAPNAAVVSSEQDLIDKFSGVEMCIIYNKIRGEKPEVKKFSDKATGAKRAWEALEEMKMETEKPKKEAKPRKKGANQKLREFFADGKGHTREEAMKALELKKIQFHNSLAYLKNPKYCGKDGVFEIVKQKGTDLYFEKSACPPPVEPTKEEKPAEEKTEEQTNETAE